MRLMVLRHASSEKAEPGMRDFDRALKECGRKDAAKMGAYMAHHALLPDRVILSPARRARETWEHVSKALSALPPVDYDNRLYEGGPDAILGLIKENDPSVRSLLIVGHNPGLHEIARQLIAAGDVEARERLNEALPPAGLVIIDFPVDEWRKVRPHHGRLKVFIDPRSL
jgi:phosphohistidine phosphatase